MSPEIPSEGIPWWFARSGGHVVSTSLAYWGAVLMLRDRRGQPLLSFLAWASVGLYVMYPLWSDWAVDDEPDNIDFHHERLWDVTNGEVARCTAREMTAWSARLAGD